MSQKISPCDLAVPALAHLRPSAIYAESPFQPRSGLGPLTQLPMARTASSTHRYNGRNALQIAMHAPQALKSAEHAPLPVGTDAPSLAAGFATVSPQESADWTATVGPAFKYGLLHTLVPTLPPAKQESVDKSSHYRQLGTVTQSLGLPLRGNKMAPSHVRSKPNVSTNVVFDKSSPFYRSTSSDKENVYPASVDRMPPFSLYTQLSFSLGFNRPNLDSLSVPGFMGLIAADEPIDLDNSGLLHRQSAPSHFLHGQSSSPTPSRLASFLSTATPTSSSITSSCLTRTRKSPTD
ncbi:hypothetical protein C8R46DRAFT_1356591 [Mycena filopes]|nr:hypothetical protein C8R46DRAFT_1356591 [Mycena filopes]